MTTLILNVDRDDDFGRKAYIISPIIGIQNHIEAAQRFGESDPEDSDLNAIYYSISLYKKLLLDRKDIEIATICGHINVGVKSDEILAKQLEEVLTRTQATEVIIVTDGAEDDYILPIIQSRVKITSIQRVTVKQSRQIEDTYYRILKMFEDEKVQKQFVLPIALVLIVGACFVLLNMISKGFGAIILTLGIYLLIRVFQWERAISSLGEGLRSGFLTGRLSIYTSAISLVIIIISIFLAYTNSKIPHEFELLGLLSFIGSIIWGIVIAGLLFIFGYVVDIYVKEKKAAWRYWIYPFSLLSFGFISSAIFTSLYKALLNWPETFYIEPFYTPFFIGNTVTGIMIMTVGIITNYYIRDIYKPEKKEIKVDR